jgi:hypothetical protein
VRTDEPPSDDDRMKGRRRCRGPGRLEPGPIEHLFVYAHTMETYDIERLRRAAAMQPPGSYVPVDRNTLVHLLGELLQRRRAERGPR